MRHRLTLFGVDDNICRVKISSCRQYMLWGDNMCHEYRHKLSPVTICVGTTIYVVTMCRVDNIYQTLPTIHNQLSPRMMKGSGLSWYYITRRISNSRYDPLCLHLSEYYANILTCPGLCLETFPKYTDMYIMNAVVQEGMFVIVLKCWLSTTSWLFLITNCPGLRAYLRRSRVYNN